MVGPCEESRKLERSWPRGFTLLELLVTIALLAFMGFLAATSFDTGSWLAHHRLKGAARELSVSMQKARMSAIKENRSWAIVFDPANNRYCICSGRGADNNWATLADNVISQTVSLTSLKSGITFGFGGAAAAADGGGTSDPVTFANDAVVFNSKGLTSSLSGFCHLTNDHGDAYAVGARPSGSIVTRKWSGSWQ
ncbi:MAG: GspH/FimT family pseudopilin [Syntrophobacteraceae bacterium]|nr:GspH/FimT family pseudopilin [Syntrophobacteraceae bacterium]